MENNAELNRPVRRLRAGKARPLTGQQTRWVAWYRDVFQSELGAAKNSGNKNPEYLAATELLSTISRFVNYAAHGMGTWPPVDGILRRPLPLIELLRGYVGVTIRVSSVKPGSETAALLNNLLHLYHNLPEDIYIDAEQYPTSLERGGELTHYDFDYRVIIPFPD